MSDTIDNRAKLLHALKSRYDKAAVDAVELDESYAHGQCQAYSEAIGLVRELMRNSTPEAGECVDGWEPMRKGGDW